MHWLNLAGLFRQIHVLRNCRLVSEGPNFQRMSSRSPNKYEKYLLVWTKKYPSVNEIPDKVPLDRLEKARNIGRIYINVGMIILTTIGAIIMIQSGKEAAKRGESVTKMNLDWHKSIKEGKEN